MGVQLVQTGPVVTHRSPSRMQPARQQVCAKAGDISAYAETRITSLRYRMPFLLSSRTAGWQILCGEKAARQLAFQKRRSQFLDAVADLRYHNRTEIERLTFVGVALKAKPLCRSEGRGCFGSRLGDF